MQWSITWSLPLIGVVMWIRALINGRVIPWLDASPRLPPWRISWGEFLLLPLLVTVLLVFVPYGLMRLFEVEATTPPSAEAMMVSGYGMGAAFIAGALLFRQLPEGRPGESAGYLLPNVGIGLLALIYFLPVCLLLAALWSLALKSLGLPDELQPIVEIIRGSDGVGNIVAWLVLVAGVAPVGEELFFRAGLFRFLANRMSPGIAATVSAALFALMHWNVLSFLPLFLLGLVLAGLYHKTGRILTAITLHAAFNLNTMLALLLSQP